MLSNKLKSLRNEKGISQSSLANHLGLTQQAIAKWEKGIAEPDSDMLKKLASFYGVSIDHLLDHTDEHTSDDASSNEDWPSDVKVMMRDAVKLNDEQKEIVRRLIKEFINEKR